MDVGVWDKLSFVEVEIVVEHAGVVEVDEEEIVDISDVRDCWEGHA